MNEYHVFVWVSPARVQFGIRLRARNKDHATLLAGWAFGNRFSLDEVEDIEVKLMRRL